MGDIHDQLTKYLADADSRQERETAKRVADAFADADASLAAQGARA